jgi:hypothetical protein
VSGELVHLGPASYAHVGRTLARRWGRELVHAELTADLFKTADAVKWAGFVLLWNGWQRCGAAARRLCELRGIPYACYEWGLLPQGSTFLVDRGMCGDSALCGDLGWVGAADTAKLAYERWALRDHYPRADEGFVLVPLQIHNDSSVLFHSRFRDMREVVDEVRRIRPGRDIVVRPHPKSPRGAAGMPAGVRVEGGGEGGGDFLSWAARASEVIGVTSTCLLEAAVYGVPVTALGDHPLRSHPRELHDTVAAGALALRVGREGADVAPILERLGLGPRPKEDSACSEERYSLVSA